MITEELDLCIDKLYAVFAKYTPKEPMEACPCCFKEGEVAILQHADIRKITADEISKYAFKAMTTCGDANNFKYFLPALLRLLATDSEAWKLHPDTLLGSKLPLAEWSQWPEQEQQIVREYLHLLWKSELENEDSGEYQDVFSGLIRAGENMLPYFVDWVNAHGKYPLVLLVDFLEDNLSRLVKKKSLSVDQQMFDWFTSENLYEHLERGFWQYADTDDMLSARISILLQVLDNIRLSANKG